MSKSKYDPNYVEKKWQNRWDSNKEYKAEVDHSKPKYYILDMFPYPSGAGLHVGHVTGYTATDILARYKRQKGFNVLHPMGWDSFGLPAEQYAVRTGTHPRITTENNINTYRRQLKSLGFSYDWDREVATSDPSYYKWTQWIFTKLYEKGLAYEADMLVNYCPALGTVLANEEVEDGKAKEGGYAIERRPLRQWVLKITAYAEKLLQDLDDLDWPEHLKQLQRNWIGRSEGAKVRFTVKDSHHSIEVFTTRSDTLFGVTYVVLSPEHPLLSEIVTADQKNAVESYQKSTASKSDLERTELAKDKTGVFTGSYALHPITKQEIPVWISDYVLMNYGTGAVMAVPAHDTRDFEFAKKFGLVVKAVISPVYTSEYALPEGLDEQTHHRCILEGSMCWEGPGKCRESAYGDLNVNGKDNEEAKKLITDWLSQKELGQKTINYKLRDWLFSRQRYWGEPFPILHFEDGSKRTLDLDELPLEPPSLTDYKPLGTGESPLAKVKEWVEVTDSKTGKKVRRETNTMPQWAGSCWYYLRFCDPLNPHAAWDHEKEKYWLPVDMYVGGVEHAVLHLLYARFWHKVLFDCGLVSTKEPFQTLRNQGLVVAKSFQHYAGGYVAPEEVEEVDGKFYQKGTHDELKAQVEKMSKSKLNGVTPDQMIEEFGADTLRLYEMFMGPFDKEKLWNTESATGCRRFLNRFWDMSFSDKVTQEDNEEANRLIHKLIASVEKDLEGLMFNTAIAKMMQFLNDFLPMSTYPVSVVKKFTQLLYPFAPHVTEEVWESLEGKQTLTYTDFPTYDPKYLEDDTILYVVQVNGKLRGKWMMPKDKSQEDILAFIHSQPEIKKHLTGEVVKVIFVPNRLINIVVNA